MLGRRTTCDDDGLVRLRLLPHHVQRRRREREFRERQLQLQQQAPPVQEEVNAILTSRHGAQRRAKVPPRRRPKQQGGGAPPLQIAALFQGYGTHYVDLWLGTPEPQRQTVIVDTGSSVTAFPCSGCQGDCGVTKPYHLDDLYAYELSTTFHQLACDECVQGHCSVSTGDNSVAPDNDECHILAKYGDSRYSAFESRDVCYVGGLHTQALVTSAGDADGANPYEAPDFAFPLTFGCQTRLTGLFVVQLADGKMGLDHAKGSFVQQMRQAGILDKESFSLCYSRQEVVSRNGTASGAMTLGGTDARLHATPMVWSTIATHSAWGDGNRFFAVHVRNVYLRNAGQNDTAVSLGLPPETYQQGQTIVDSGTTDSYFPSAIADAFQTVFEQVTEIPYPQSGRPSELTLEEIQTLLPTILIQIEVGSAEEALNRQVPTSTTQQQRDSAGTGLAGEVDSEHPYDVLLAIPPTHYMEYDRDREAWINRFYTDDPVGDASIGANAMMGHDVYFDPENRRLGWAESNCDYDALLEEHQFGPDEAARQQRGRSSDKTPLAIGEWCSTPTCQYGALAGIALAVALFASVVVRRRRRRRAMESAAAAVVREVELPETARGRRYRDNNSEAEAFHDEPSEG